MPRQEIDGLCIKVNEEFNMGEQYFKGVLAGYLGANFMCGPITEWQIDIIKENILHYCEVTIDQSKLSYQEKEDQKRQMKQSLEVYIQGVKDEMRAKGRMISVKDSGFMV